VNHSLSDIARLFFRGFPGQKSRRGERIGTGEAPACMPFSGGERIGRPSVAPLHPMEHARPLIVASCTGDQSR
jgi:hypothetical protein